MKYILRSIAIASCLVFSTPIWATSSRLCEQVFSSVHKNRILENIVPYPDLTKQDPHYGKPPAIQALTHVVLRDYMDARFASMAPGPRERLKDALLKRKLKNMSLNDLGETNRSNLLRRTAIVFNSLIGDSPLFPLIMAHELDHASRSVTVKGRIERFWNYKFVENEESSAAAAEFVVLQGLLKTHTFEEARSSLEDRYINNRHISVHRGSWYKRGWIDEAGLSTVKGILFLNSLVQSKPEILAKKVAEDPELKAYLTSVYDLIFLEKLELAAKSDLKSYVDAQCLQYGGASVRHWMILGTIHADGLLALTYGLFQLF
jgi:hypothetical protein